MTTRTTGHTARGSAPRPASGPGRRALLHDLTLGPRWWVGTFVAYLLTRVVAVLGFASAARTGMECPQDWVECRIDGPWNLMNYAWDGYWYSVITDAGYPDAVPVNENGHATYSPWPFYPLFPGVVRLLSTVTFLPATFVALAVASTSGLFAVVLLRRLLLAARPRLDRERPWFLFTAPLALAAFPAAGVFSANYSEALALVVLLAALLALVRERYVVLAAMILLLGLSRPLAVPLGLVILVHFWPRIVPHLRATRSVPWRPVVQLVLLGCVSIVSVVLWPAAAALVTGQADALFTAQGAWVRLGNADASVPFAVLDVQVGANWRGRVFVVMLIALALALPRLRPLRELGPVISTWTSVYLVFILATVGLGPSVPRYLLPALSLHLALACWVRRPWQAAILLGGLTLLQFAWVWVWWSHHLSP